MIFFVWILKPKQQMVFSFLHHLCWSLSSHQKKRFSAFWRAFWRACQTLNPESNCTFFPAEGVQRSGIFRQKPCDIGRAYQGRQGFSCNFPTKWGAIQKKTESSSHHVDGKHFAHAIFLKNHYLRGSRNWLSFHSPTPSYNLPESRPHQNKNMSTRAHEDLARPPTQKSNAMIQLKDWGPNKRNLHNWKLTQQTLPVFHITIWDTNQPQGKPQPKSVPNSFVPISYPRLDDSLWIPPKKSWPNNSVRKILIST